MNNKDKGNIGESVVLAEFIKRGITVSIPFGDNARYDLVADFNGRLNKIQVKYCNQKESDNHSIACPCSSCTNHTKNKGKQTYKNDIDYFAFYMVEWNVTLLVPISEIENKKEVRFRMDKPRNNNKAGIHFVDDYLLDKIIPTQDVLCEKNK